MSAEPVDEAIRLPLTTAMRNRRPNVPVPQAKPIRTTVPMDFHPDALGKDNGTHAYKKAHSALAALWDVHNKLNQTAVQVQDRAALAKHIEPLALRAMKSMRTEISSLDAQIAHAETEIGKALGSGVGAIATETRAVLRAMPEKERFNFCRQLAASGDVESLKAVASVSPFLSGLAPDVYALVREMAERAVAAQFVDERDTGLRAKARMQRAVTDFDEQIAGNIKRWRASDEQKIADLVKSLTVPADG